MPSGAFVKKRPKSSRGHCQKGAPTTHGRFFFMGAECPNRLADDSGDDSVYVTYMFNVIKN